MVAVPSTPIIPFAPPSGLVTFLFTDIEGSTSLWERDRTMMRVALERHNTILAAAIRAHGGYHFKTIGDAFQAASADPVAAVAACVDAQRALDAEPWPETGPLRVRMALHRGEAEPSVTGDYLNRRLPDAGAPSPRCTPGDWVWRAGAHLGSGAGGHWRAASGWGHRSLARHAHAARSRRSGRDLATRHPGIADDVPPTQEPGGASHQSAAAADRTHRAGRGHRGPARPPRGRGDATGHAHRTRRSREDPAGARRRGGFTGDVSRWRIPGNAGRSRGRGAAVAGGRGRPGCARRRRAQPGGEHAHLPQRQASPARAR